MIEPEHLPMLAPDGSPATLAPLSAATIGGGVVATSGQAPVDGATGALLATDLEEQAEIVLGMLDAVLMRAGTTRGKVLRCECYLARAEDFAAFNAVYARWFPPPSPARTTVVVGFAIPGMLVEVQALALR